ASVLACPRAISAATNASRRGHSRGSSRIASHTARTSLSGRSHLPGRALGVESSTQVCTIAASPPPPPPLASPPPPPPPSPPPPPPAPLWPSPRRSASITLPPKLCPAIAVTRPPSSASSPTHAATSAAHAAIVCGGAPGSDRPCPRRSTRTTPHAARRST